MPYSFKGKLLKVLTQKRRLPDGRLTTLDIIDHPGAVLIVPFLDQKRLIFIRQYRSAIQRFIYELPAGTLNPRESLTKCAHRELAEETGYRAGKMSVLGNIFPVPGYSTEVITIFKAQGLSPLDSDKGKVDVIKDPDEVIRVRVLSRVQIQKIFRSGRLNDAKTICALGFCGFL